MTTEPEPGQSLARDVFGPLSFRPRPEDDLGAATAAFQAQRGFTRAFRGMAERPECEIWDFPPETDLLIELAEQLEARGYIIDLDITGAHISWEPEELLLARAGL
ncbi:hypothetical protein [Gryllotalpicola kribbensis]